MLTLTEHLIDSDKAFKNEYVDPHGEFDGLQQGI